MPSFDYPTNFSNGTSVDGVGSMFAYGAYATGGWFGYGILFMIFIIAFGVSALANIGRAFASAIFITFIFSIYFARIEMVSHIFPLVLLTMVIIGFFWAKSERSNY